MLGSREQHCIAAILAYVLCISFNHVSIYCVTLFEATYIDIYLSSFVLQNKKTVAARQKDLDKMAQRIQEVKDASEKDAADYAAAQKHFQAVSSGLSANDDGEAATLNEQLLGTT